MSRLTCYVHVGDTTGRVVAFGPGDVVPDWARAKITNPNVWDQAPEAVPVMVGGGGGPSVVTVTVVESSDDGPPPQKGPQASRLRWADYATTQGVSVEESWKREDIIGACESAGVAV